MPDETQTAARRWRHKKRGGVYEEIGRGYFQSASFPPSDGLHVVIYRSEDGKFWVRQMNEFEDGRFEEVTTWEARADPLKDISRADLEEAFLDQSRLASQLGRDVVTLQQAMMEVWHHSSDDAKIVIERAMAATGMPRAPR